MKQQPNLFFLCFLFIPYLVFSLKNKGIKKKVEYINDYHFPMVNDEIRNNMYYSALKQVISPQKNLSLIDVGAGTMLLSMIAMELGAKRTLGVESNPTMAKIAKEVLKVNNYQNQLKSGKIDLYEGDFESLRLTNKQVKEPFDVMISETFDSALIGEGFLSILTHAKSSGLLRPDSIMIPNSAVIFGQLLESTFSLPRGDSQDQFTKSNTNFYVRGVGDMRFNLEPMRRFRPSNGYTVRYLNEQNAIRKTLSSPRALFNYDFQNFNFIDGNFAYTCLVFEIDIRNPHNRNVTDEGVFDAIGLWFNLYLDKDKKLVLSNAPPWGHTNGGNSPSGGTSPSLLSPLEGNQSKSPISEEKEKEKEEEEDELRKRGREERSRDHSPPHLAPCWMQALYRTSHDVFVKQGDVIRLQIVQTQEAYIFGDVGIGRHNSLSRLVKFNIFTSCENSVEIYGYRNDDFIDRRQHARWRVNSLGDFNGLDDQEDDEADNLYLLASIPPPGEMSPRIPQFKVLAARVYQRFLIVTKRKSTGRLVALRYQLPDSTGGFEGTPLARAKLSLPLDSYDINC